MRKNERKPLGFAARLLAWWVLAAVVVGAPAWLTADLAAQAPAKKVKEEVEEPTPKAPAKQSKPEVEETSKPAKPPTLRVEDEEPTPAKPAKVGIPRLDELARDAKGETPAIRALYQQLATPHDLVHWNYGALDRPMKVEPFPARVAEKTKYSGQARLRHIPEPGGRAIEAEFKDVKFIEPFELIAVRRVNEFLATHKDPKTFSMDYLQAAERVLAAVESFHESAREQGIREGDGWKDVSDQVRKRLRDVQKQQLEYYAEKNEWEPAYAAAVRLAEAYPRPEAQQEFVAAMSRFVTDLLKQEKYADAQKRMAAISMIFPKSQLGEDTNNQLKNKAQDLYRQALERIKAKDSVTAGHLLDTAASIWPRLPNIQNERLKLRNEYPILNVGVARLPERFAPWAACTDTELLALDLLFESLVKPVFNKQIGQRYYPVLAADHPRLIPLGREFDLLREAAWSDGKPVNGVDVRESLEKVLRDQRGLANDEPGDRLQPLKDARIEGDDAYRVALSLRRGFLDPLALMSFKIVPYRSNLKPEEFARQPIGSGPFELKDRRKDEVVFEADSYYRRASRPGMPYIREIHFFRSTDPAKEFARANQRMHLLLDIPTRDLPTLESLKRVQHHTLRPRRVYFLAVNHRNQLLHELDPRRAIGLAIDREAVLDTVFRPKEGQNKRDFHRALTGPYPPKSWAYNEDFKPHPDPAAMAKTIATKESRLRGARLSLKYPNDDPRVKLACEEIAKQVKAATEVQLDLVPLAPAQLRHEVENEHKYDLAYYRLDYADETYSLWPLFDDRATGTGGSNYLGYVDDAQLLTNFRSALDHRDFDKVRAFTHDIHKQIYDKMPLIPLWQLDMHIAVHDELHTATQDARHLDPLHLFSDIEQWKLR